MDFYSLRHRQEPCLEGLVVRMEIDQGLSERADAYNYVARMIGDLPRLDPDEDMPALSSGSGRPVRDCGHVLRQFLLLVVMVKLIGRRLAVQMLVFDGADEIRKGPLLE